MLARLRNALPAVIGLVLFVAALEVLRTELRAVTWHELTRDILGTPGRSLALALLAAILNYAVLIAYDFLALASIGQRLPREKVALTSFLAYAVANNVGWAVLSGASIRYRFYSRWGITTEQLARVVFFYSITFWIGLLLLGGFSLTLGSVPAPLDTSARSFLAPLGVLLVAGSFAYVLATFVRRDPLRLGGIELVLPPPRLAVLQLLVSIVDWTLAGLVLYALLPPSNLTFFGALSAFLAAQLLGLASHVPGGVGVFEGLIVLLLQPFLQPSELLPSLVVYRVVYYLLPLTITVVVLVIDEVQLRRAQAMRVGAAVSRMAEELVPRLLAGLTFVSGAVLLFSGATPDAARRLALLHRFVPIGIIETSHFVGSLIGVALLLLARGLARRLDAAYALTVTALIIGIAALLLKGVNYEAAAILAVVFVLLWRARPAFDRRAALFETSFTAGWIAAIVGALAASLWLGLFAFQRVEYSQQLWWQFELHGDASRFMRATVGGAVALALVGFARLIGYAPHEVVAPTNSELETAGAIIETQSSTRPYLIYLRDKAVLFDESQTAFLMYGVQGRTWVALGDPVGSEDSLSGLVRSFMERCDDYGGTPVFYEVGKDQLYRYADFGLTLVKLGEEATVNLSRFSLQGGHASKLRQAVRRLEKDHAMFRVLTPAEVAGSIEQLRGVSDDWLRKKSVAEKGFSLGFFEPGYVTRFPVAVVEREGRVVAFANLWPGPRHVELSLDLMRYHHAAPKDVMEGLFVNVLQWAKGQGYARVSLGIAPLSGFERSPVAPLWNRLGSFLYQHGARLYNFQGLRAYKEKFSPDWEPRYLVYPGGLRLPRILADIAALIAGGYRAILIK